MKTKGVLCPFAIFRLLTHKIILESTRIRLATSFAQCTLLFPGPRLPVYAIDWFMIMRVQTGN